MNFRASNLTKVKYNINILDHVDCIRSTVPLNKFAKNIKHENSEAMAEEFETMTTEQVH